MSWLPDWDMTDVQRGSMLPFWAHELSRDLEGRYRLTTMQVYDGRAVVAVRVDGAGPLLVVTGDEGEMRQALGLKPLEQTTYPGSPG